MEKHFKTPRQIEFADLMEVMRSKGFRPADVSRLLEISKASVSKILAGKQNPEPSKLELFRRVAQNPDKGPAVYPERQELVLQDGSGLAQTDPHWLRLQELPEEDRRAVHSHIDFLHSRAKQALAEITDESIEKIRKKKKPPATS